jgi:hypothetical protein
MDLFLHVFNLGTHVPVLSSRLVDACADLAFAFGLADEQVTVLDLEFNHLLPQHVVVADLGLQRVDLGLHLVDDGVLGVLVVLLVSEVLSRRRNVKEWTLMYLL